MNFNFNDRNEYRQNLQQLIQENENLLKQFLQQAIQEQVGLAVSRQVYQDFIELISPTSTNTIVKEEILLFALNLLHSRTVAFEDQITSIRILLADYYESIEEWVKAAQMLKGIPLDSGTRAISSDFKLSIYIRIVRLYLEEEDSASADQYLSKAQMLTTQDKRLGLELVACQARSFDFKRQFIPSALKYLELSYVLEMDQQERLQALGCACICAILAPAGPQRQRLLSTLYKDERFQNPELQKEYTILEKMYLERVCKQRDVQPFKQLLKEHQLALLSDGSTVLDRAIREHNILSISKLYNNISFQELANLLDVDVDKAESLVGQMISEMRMEGKMDQLEKLIYFEKEKSLKKWDDHISGFCYQLDDICNLIQIKYL